MTEKMISTISKNYANALIDSSVDSIDLIKVQLEEVVDVIKKSDDLKVVMDNYSISTVQKFDIIESIFESKIDKRIINLLKILIEKNRFSEIFAINEAFKQVLDKRSNKKNVEIISSIELSGDIKNRILEKLKNKLNSDITAAWQVDESIIAGLKFKFDDYVIDSSVRTKLKKLSSNILR